MSITYCSLIAKSEKILLAESTMSESFDSRIKGLIGTILKKNVCDTIEIEGENLVTYLRTKKVIFCCVAPTKHGEERPRRFIEQFAGMVIKEFESIDNIVPQGNFGKLALQAKLEVKFNTFLGSFDTGMYKNKDIIIGMSKDLDEMKQAMGISIKKMVNNKDELEEMLIVSKKITHKAEEYKEGAKELEYETRCIKPWMVYLLVVIVVLFIVYTAFALYYCGAMTLFCEKKKATSRNLEEYFLN
jgi:hypothetical protein